MIIAVNKQKKDQGKEGKRMSNKLHYFNQIYENIMHSDGSREEKDRQFARLMTDLEREYKIPILRDLEWEKKNKAVVALYRKISMSRTL